MSTSRLVRLGHSPDPDDAFMFYAIAAGKIDTAGFVFEQVLEDIESLNRRALAAELEVSALSIHACAFVADRYALMPCGASMGDGYGPCLVARAPLDLDELAGETIAVPDADSAFLCLRLLSARIRHRVIPFTDPRGGGSRRRRRRADHPRGQLTYSALNSPWSSTSARVAERTGGCRCPWAATSCARIWAQTLAA